MSRLVDAERLTKDILGLQDCYNGFSDTYDKECIIGVIDEQPTIDAVSVVRGRWEEVEVTWLADVADQPDAIASMFCPVCRRFANHVYHYGNPRYGMNFCPHCGARMGGDAK